MKKKKIYVRDSINLDQNDEPVQNYINSLILAKEKLINKYPEVENPEVYISYDGEYNYGEWETIIKIVFTGYRWETDEEFNNRKNRKLAKIAATVKRKKKETEERELYEKLKKKYEV